MVSYQALIRIFGGIRNKQVIGFNGVVGAKGFEPSTSWSRIMKSNSINASSGVA